MAKFGAGKRASKFMQAIFMPQKTLPRGLGEVGITLILGGNIIGKTDTISLAIYNAVYDGRSDQALALSLVLVVLSFILFFIINLLEKSRI